MATADVLTEQQLTEIQYDRTVREDIELFRSQAYAAGNQFGLRAGTLDIRLLCPRYRDPAFLSLIPGAA